MVRSRRIGVFEVVNALIMVLVMFMTLFPFWYSIVGSLNEGLDYMRGGVYFWPRKPTLENYHAVLQNEELVRAFFISVARTTVGTALALLVSSLFAYGFSKKRLMFRAFFAALGVGSMYFNGGIIPIYLNIRMLGLLNNFFVYIFPTLFSFFNVLILMSFFRTIPSSIEESAYMDGAGNYLIFFRLILPLSKPVIASIALFVAVFHWNSYFDSMMYTTRTELQTIQLFIVKMVRNREAAANMAQQYAAMYQDQQTVTSTTLQFATMALTSLPIILLYPFLQRYFVKGIMIGSIKG